MINERAGHKVLGSNLKQFVLSGDNAKINKIDNKGETFDLNSKSFKSI